MKKFFKKCFTVIMAALLFLSAIFSVYGADMRTNSRTSSRREDTELSDSDGVQPEVEPEVDE